MKNLYIIISFGTFVKIRVARCYQTQYRHSVIHVMYTYTFFFLYVTIIVEIGKFLNCVVSFFFFLTEPVVNLSFILYSNIRRKRNI